MNYLFIAFIYILVCCTLAHEALQTEACKQVIPPGYNPIHFIITAPLLLPVIGYFFLIEILFPNNKCS